MQANGLVPDWLPLAGSLVMIAACVVLGKIENRGVIFVGILPYTLYSILYVVLFLDLQPWEESIAWRQDFARTAFFVQSLWVGVVVLNGYVNKVLTLIARRLGRTARLDKEANDC